MPIDYETQALSQKTINAIRQSRPRLENIIEELTPALTSKKAVKNLHVQVAQIKDLETLFPYSRSIGLPTTTRKQLKVVSNILESNRTAMLDGVITLRDAASSIQGAIVSLSLVLKTLNNVEIPNAPVKVQAVNIIEKTEIVKQDEKVEASQKLKSFSDLNVLIDKLKKEDQRIKMLQNATKTNVASPATERMIQNHLEDFQKVGNTPYNNHVMNKKPWERKDLSPAANRARLERTNVKEIPNSFDQQADAQIKKVFGKIAAQVKKIPKISGNKPVFTKAPLFVTFQGYPPNEAEFKKAAIISHALYPGVVLENQFLIGIPLSNVKPASANKMISDVLESLAFRIDDELINVLTKKDKIDSESKNSLHYAGFSWPGSQFKYFWFMPRQQFNRLGRVAIKEVAIADPGQIFKQSDAKPVENISEKIQKQKQLREEVQKQGDAEVAGLRQHFDRILKEIGNYKDSVVSVDREIESKTLVAQHQKRLGDKKGLTKTLKELEDLQIKKEAMEKEIIGPLKKQAKDITDNIDKVFERLRKEKLGK